MSEQQIELIAKNIKANVMKIQEVAGFEDNPFTRLIAMKKLIEIARDNTDQFPALFLMLYMDVLSAMIDEQIALSKIVN